ncbi:MAG: hypothetical protein K2H19_00695 [Ruminococcus sp.]|nr:hypothetical protein [Ruminococcus sp.]
MLSFLKRIVVAVTASMAVSTVLISTSTFADWKQIGFMGDINGDKLISIADAVLMTKHLLGSEFLSKDNGYEVSGKRININGGDSFISDKTLQTADINQDGRIDVYDLIMLRKNIAAGVGLPVMEWEEETISSVSSDTSFSTTSTTTTTTTTSAQKNSFIEPPVYDLYGSMPSQGDAELLIFYVDFPDCKYDYNPTADEINKIAFGYADEKNINYPFESMSAFYNRSSKGAMKLNGTTYTYTAKNNKSYYEGDVWHVALVDEIIAEFDKTIDFSEFDGNNDKIIDSILISVPESAGNENWWASAGAFGGDSENRADGMNIGHVIVGNAEIKSADDYSSFNSSYLHEMGHCMGLPDYYLYGVEDFQGMHGSAGFEMMDDANCDFGAVSKLMLGWYTSEQINIFDKNTDTQKYTLFDAQTDNGNCVIIPCKSLGDKYRSEFFIIEYTSLKNNNSNLANEWWRSTGEGVRVYHAETSESGDLWYNTFKYASGNDETTNYGNGRRFIRLVGESDDSTDNLFKAGDIIDNTVPEFNIYDDNGQQTIDPEITITVGEINGENCTVTISKK